MEDLRRQTVQGCKRVQIGRVNFAIDPGLQTEGLCLGRIERTVADAMDRMPHSRQFANEMTSDESVRTGNPRGHVLDLVTDERIKPAGPVVKGLGKREQGR